MSLPEQPRDRAGSIPVQQSTPVINLEHSDMPYTRSSVCSSVSTSSTFLTSTSQPDLLVHQPPTKTEFPPSPNLTRHVHREEKSEQDHTTTSSATSSLKSSNSSTNEELESKSHNEMLSAENVSDSMSNSMVSSTHSLTMPPGEAPTLPARSARRASRLITPIPPKKTASDERPMLPHAAPHQIYLSSEEDASSSADDFSDFGEELESDKEQSQKSTERRISREDTARMVAVVFYGKPSIVTLSPRRSISPSSSNGHQTGAGILRAHTEPALSRPRSVSSTSSTTTTTAFNLPPRSSSMMTTGFEKKRPRFLHIDQYARNTDEHHETTRATKTPTAMLRKTLSLVKKRSKQNLHQSESQITPMEQVGEVDEENDPRESICLDSPTPSSVSYQDIIRSAKRNASISLPRNEVSSPKSPKTRFRAGLSLGRQRSVRA